MWEAIIDMFKNGQGIWVIIVFTLLIVAGYLGLVKIKSDKIIFGKGEADRERMIMKKQYEYARNTCEAFEKRIPRFEGYKVELGELISEKALDEIVNWIMFNHIEDSDDYISIKQELIWNVVCKESVDKRIQSDKFKETIYKNVEQVVKRLVQIRHND